MPLPDDYKAYVRVVCVATTDVTIATALVPGASLGGRTLVAGDLILLMAQTAAEENGLYLAATVPARDSNYASQATGGKMGPQGAYDLYPGMMVSDENSGHIYRCVSTRGGTIDVDELTFNEVIDAGSVALTAEEVQDIVGDMVSGGTESGIDVTYDDAAGKLNFVTLLVSAIDPPTPDPTANGVQWYNPSTGEVWVWYNGEWVETGTIAPESPTPLTGQALTVTIGPVAMLIKRLDLPVPYFDGGNSYYAQFTNANAVGWSDPSFFMTCIWYSPAQSPHAANIAAAGIKSYLVIEGNAGNITYALAEGLGVIPQSHLVEYWTPDRIDSEDGDSNPLVAGWHVYDEPDMFATLALVEEEVARVEALNDGRFTHLNIGNGITGSPLWSPTTVDDMVQSVHAAGVDAYAYSSELVRYNLINSPYWPGPGVSHEEARRSATYGWLTDRMKVYQDTEEKKPTWVMIETALPLIDTNIDTGDGNVFGLYVHPGYVHITLPQISGAAWSCIRHGARGIGFFQHNNNGIDDFYSLSSAGQTVIRGQVTALITEIDALAEVIDGITYEWDFGDANIETCLKTLDDDAYIFAGVALAAPLPGGGNSDITQVGTTLEFQFSDTADTGTVSSAITVPEEAELVVVGVSGLHGTADGFDAMTFTKGGVDTAMTKATGGDVSGASWQSAIFYLDLPDTGASKSLKWDWLGVASSGPRVVTVTFWQGIDLSEPVRDSDGVQDTSFPLETPTLVETPTIAAGDGDKILVFCGMRNDAADGAAKVNVWHHSATLGDQPTHSGIAEASLATGTPDGDCTVGFENISAASEAAVVAVAMKAATLEAVSTTVVQTGSLVQLPGSTANTGTYTGTFTVPADCELILAGVVGFTGVANGLASISMMKGGIMTPMVKLESGDGTATTGGLATVQGALFYMVNPDVGAGLTATWDWAGSAVSVSATQLTMTFWKDVDTADPVRDSQAVQAETIPLETPVLTNREGDLVVAYFAGYAPGSVNSSVDTWKNVTTLENPVNDNILDCAWATASVIGSMKVGVETVTTFLGGGALCAVTLKPAAAVTPITPASDPPTTPRTVITGTFTLPPDLAAATTVEVLNESRSISVTAGVFEDEFDEEWSYHNYRIAIP